MVLTVRTSDGGLLGLVPVQNDTKPEHFLLALESLAGPQKRSCVQWLVVDNVFGALYAELLPSYPCLRGVVLDTCHRPVKYEPVASNHRSAGSSMLRRLVRSSTSPSQAATKLICAVLKMVDKVVSQARQNPCHLCGNEALHVELRGAFRQVYEVSAPTFQLKLDLFTLSKQTDFDAALMMPNLRQMKQGFLSKG